MKVLIACEFSGTVRDAFTSRGHFARSCDLLPTESLPDAVTFRADFGCFDHETFRSGCDACENDEPWCHKHGEFAYECLCLGPTEDEAEYADEFDRGARHRSGDIFTVEDIESYDLLIAHPPCTHLAVSGARWLTRHWVKKGSGGYWHDPSAKLTAQAEAVEFVRRLLALPVSKIAIENPISRLSTLLRKPDQVIHPWQFGHGETKATCLWLKNLPRLTATNVVKGRVARVHNLPPSADRWKLRSLTYRGIAEAMADQWGNAESVRAAA